MSLLEDRDDARYRLEYATKALLECSDWDNIHHSHPHKKLLKSGVYVQACKKRAKKAKTNLQTIDRKLSKIKNHCGHTKVELYAKFMLVFKPELKKEVEALITFT